MIFRSSFKDRETDKKASSSNDFSVLQKKMVVQNLKRDAFFSNLTGKVFSCVCVVKGKIMKN